MLLAAIVILASAAAASGAGPASDALRGVAAAAGQGPTRAAAIHFFAGAAGPRPRTASARHAVAHTAGAAPTATLSIPLVEGDTCTLGCPPSNTIAFLQSNDSTLTITVGATPAPGQTISTRDIILQYAPAGTGTWSSLFNVGFSGSGPYTAQLGYHNFPLFPPLQGDYDLRVAVTDSSGQTGYTQTVRNVVVDDDDTARYVPMGNPGSFLSGSVNLVAAPDEDGAPNLPDTVTFQISAVGQNDWTTIGSPAALEGTGNPEYGVTLDTATFLYNGKPLDGSYDLRDTAEDSAGDPYVGNVITVTIGNMPPTVTLTNPGTSLSGIVGLEATAASGSGIVAVRFQYARSGTGKWSTIGVATVTPYTVSFDTRSLQNGVYDLRAVATDIAGNTATSVVSGVSIANSTATGVNPGGFAVTDTDVPATGVGPGAPITLLGEIAGSSDHETWAYGYTTAPPATADGTAPLPYTAAAGTPQLVLLRYTDEGGWQIADVLRDADGSAFDVPAGADVYGQMTATGEAWIVIAGSGIQVSAFHRLPGGQFLLDNSASDMLGQLFSGAPPLGVKLTLGQSADGTVYGVLVNQSQVSQQASAPGGTQINTALSYGQLVDGAWSVQNAPVPPSYQPVTGDTLKLEAVSPTGPGSGWGVFGVSQTTNNSPLMLGSFSTPTPTATVGRRYRLPTSSIAISSVADLPSSGSFAVSVNGGSGTDSLSYTGITPDVSGTGGTLTGVNLVAGQSGDTIAYRASVGPVWQFVSSTGLDALDLTGGFAGGSAIQVDGQGILAATDGVWIQAEQQPSGGTVVALYDPTSGHVVQSWCDPSIVAESAGCAQTIDDNDPAVLPAAAFGDTPQDSEALALGNQSVDVYANGRWSPVAAPGFNASNGSAVFEDPTDGWLAGTNSVGQITPQAPVPALTEWPEANQATLVSAALPPDGAGIGTSGALAVGLDGTALHYDASNGWLVDPLPTQAGSINLLGVAYDGPSRAVAVGALGTILDWNGTSWSADPQSVSLTENQLNAVAFAGDGQGWAVGTFGTILHYDGTAWSQDQIDPADQGTDVTSVAVAGDEVFAVAGGNLITRETDGTWQRVDPSLLPSDLSPGSLTLVSGLPDGGVVAAGDSVVLVRQSGSSSFQYTDQPIQGIAVALTAFKDPSSGQVRAFVSVAPPADVLGLGDTNVAGFPAGDGDLLMQTSTGWEDLSRSQSPISGLPGSTPGDGAPQPDPVLAVAAASDGSAAWVFGGYAGTQTASGLGSGEPLPARPFAWQTASIWRYDQGGGTPPPTLTQAQASLPAQPNTVSFAFFSSAECAVECSQVQDAQPDVNLEGAAGEIADFAAQPGGPAFAMLGGNAVGPTNLTALNDGNGAVDLANLHQYLSALGSLPLYAAYGPLDAVPTASDPAQPWDDAFAQSPAPFGLGAAPSGITPVSSGGQDESVNHYYAYDVAQNGGTLRVIVLDNSAGSLDASEPGQAAWLNEQLAAAQTAGVPVVVVTAQPLDSDLSGSAWQVGYATDANSLATTLADAGVLAVFTTSATQSDQMHMIPYEKPNARPTGAPQIPEYEGASVGYQQTQNNGVLWYFVSVDTATDTLTVQGIPVVSSLALEPLDGLSVARSSTLSFRAIGRRPAGTLAATADQSSPQGFANYVAIPSPSCSGCITPSYSFASSNPAIGNFVAPSGPGSQFPKLSATGKTTASSTSGLFCAFNAGQTTVSVTSGLLTSSLTVTVEAGNIGQPCGTVTYPPDETTVTVLTKPKVSTETGSLGQPNVTAPPPTVVQHVNPTIPKILVPPPVPAPVIVAAPFVPPPPVKPVPKPITPPPPPVVAPSPLITPVPSPVAFAAVPPVVVPPIPPPITPVPPGGATAPAQSTAKREERARKHASQSAYMTRPAGTPAEEWFYPAVGVVSVLAMLLVASGMRPGPKPKLALLHAYETDDPRLRRRSRR